NRIRRIDAGGVITTIAGVGPSGFAGDGGLATDADLFGPGALAFDHAGNLYVADANNNRIRRIDAAGVITTVAGTGDMGPAGDGGPATAAQLFQPNGVALDTLGNIYIADTGNNLIRRIDSAGIITTVAGTGYGGYTGDGVAATS